MLARMTSPASVVRSAPHVPSARRHRPGAPRVGPETRRDARVWVLVALLATTPTLACGGSGGASVDTEAEAAGGEQAAAPTGPDTDGDGTPDALDRCVEERGEAVAGGCPPYDADMDGTPEAWSEFACRARACTQSYCIREAPAMPVLYFPQGRVAGLTSQIPALAAALGDSGDAYISGHSSPDEPPELGRQRAEWVIARLAAHGVDTARLQAVGFGSHWAKVDAPEGMNAADADRRVEVIATWYGPPGCTSHAVPADKCPVRCE